MIWIRILYSLNFLVFVVLPFMYKSSRPSMMAFYDSMIWRKSARRFYTLVFFLFLIVFHFYYLTIFENHYDVILSTALCYVMLSHKLFEKTIRFLQDRYTYFGAMLITVACLFIPHLFTLGVSFGIIMLATLFYPPEWWKNKREDLAWIDKIYFETNLLPSVYFSWKEPDKENKNKNDKKIELLTAEEIEYPMLPFYNPEIEDVEYENVPVPEPTPQSPTDNGSDDYFPETFPYEK